MNQMLVSIQSFVVKGNLLIFYHRCLPPQVWGVIWFLVSLLFLGSSIVVALVVFD
jgi:hypothetical protein